MDLFDTLMASVKKNTPSFSKEEVAEFLKANPESLARFEEIYQPISDEENKASGNLFKRNSRNIQEEMAPVSPTLAQQKLMVELTERIVNELLMPPESLMDKDYPFVTQEEINQLPPSLRPQLTGRMYKKDTAGDSCEAILWNYAKWLNEGDKKSYDRFRQGLDILDLDSVTYKIIGTNPTSMGHWLPTLEDAVSKQSFFKVPETKVVKVPLPILQLTHLDYMSLTPTTLMIVDEWCKKAFELDENKTYFIKTGTYSSKFDFRNAKVTTPKEVNEIGQYLTFIHFQALSMAHYDLSGRHQPSIYGVSTTNEWVVREYIEDKENLPCIYHGMPLHTEYRAFIDFDKKELLGVVPYWDTEMLKERFSKGSDAGSADMKHDYVIVCHEEQRLKETFEKNKDKVEDRLKTMVFDMNLTGQWSLDIMQNGDDFYAIDMAPAYLSALRDKISQPERIVPMKEDWLPKFDDNSPLEKEEPDLEEER